MLFTVNTILFLAAQTTTLAGVASDGTLPDEEARLPALSADGQYVAFDAKATNLAPNDVNGTHDVFRHVLATGSTDLVSVSISGTTGNGQSLAACISNNGRHVAFESFADDLVLADTNAARDVFVRDLWQGVTERVSVSTAGLQGDGASRGASISSDGRFVAFSSTSTNLVAGDDNGVEDVFVRDRRTGTTWRASVSTQGAQGSQASYEPVLSADGGHLAFIGLSPELAMGAQTGKANLFVADLDSGVVVVVQPALGGQQLPFDWAKPALSADGRHVAFQATVGGVYVHDLVADLTVRADVNAQGVPADLGSFRPSLTADGRQVAFMSIATNFGSGGNQDRVYVRDLDAATTEMVSLSTSGQAPNLLSNFPSISADGRLVAFASLATNLIPNAALGNDWKVFVHDRQGCTPTIATYCTSSATSLGCVAGIVATGTPSLSSPLGFEVASGTLPGDTLGVACVGIAGPDATPIGTQGGMLCVGSFARSAPVLSGGSAGACNGELRLTLADLVATEPAIADPSGMVWVQFWFRDAGSADGFGLSNALWFQTCP